MHFPKIKTKRTVNKLSASLIFSLAFFIHFSSQAQNNDSTIVDSIPKIVEDTERFQSLLWEINRDDLAKPSFLYGTIHLIPKDSFFLLPAVKEKLAYSDRLVMELASVQPNMIMMLTSIVYMRMPSGTTFKSLYNEEEYQQISSFMKDSLNGGLPLPYTMIKPIITTQLINQLYCPAEKQESYEIFFSDLFKKAQKPITGLETVQEQMSVLSSIPLEQQAKGLLETVKNPRMACKQYEELVSIYRSQDLDKLMEMMGESDEVEGQLDQLLDNRNQNWISKIEEMAAKESIFIAVGAGHLAGKKGVIHLLRQQGYSVKPL